VTARVAVVTGAARGLGREIAQRLASQGDHVVIADLRADLAESTAAELRAQGLEVTAVATDIADTTSVRALAETVAGLGGVDVLVNNAALADGVGGDTFWELDEEAYLRVMTVNTYGTWLACKYLVPQMIEKRSGAVVNMASDAAFYGSPRLVHYVGSKGSVLAMTRSMARDAGPFGVRINAVAPGLIRVEATESVPDSRYELYQNQRVLPRDQTPSDVSGAVSFLLSQDAAYMTGQTLVVDGGFVMTT
jgi:NAD(P)-dependent dehydrogenase (short-subunit alcohol dehydrogenase family)